MRLCARVKNWIQGHLTAENCRTEVTDLYGKAELRSIVSDGSLWFVPWRSITGVRGVVGHLLHTATELGFNMAVPGRVRLKRWIKADRVKMMLQPAVFAKNHLSYLKVASEIAACDAAQLVTFRSSRKWAGASLLLDTHGNGTLPVLFAVVDHGPEVRFRALLQEVKLSPSAGDPRTEQLLRLRPPNTRNEDPWENNTKTLYAISGCHELQRPLPYSELLKQSDGQPLDDNFRYSYALINCAEPGDGAVPPTLVASDVATPPARVNAVVSRIVRDTSLTRQLKALHDHRCQICGTRLAITASQGYSEAHHLKPLGRPHDGPDTAANIVILCPNCHALCDNAALTLSRDTLPTVSTHEVGDEFLEYHNGLVESWKATY